MFKTITRTQTPAQAQTPAQTPAPHIETSQNDADANIRATARVAPTSVSDIVGAYKSLVANGCLNIYKSKMKQWVNCGNEIITNISFVMMNPIKPFLHIS